MLPLPESAVLTGQIRLQSENYFNKSKLNTLLSIFPLKTYFDSDSEVCRTDVAVSICTHIFSLFSLSLNIIERKKCHFLTAVLSSRGSSKHFLIPTFTKKYEIKKNQA